MRVLSIGGGINGWSLVKVDTPGTGLGCRVHASPVCEKERETERERERERERKREREREREKEKRREESLSVRGLVSDSVCMHGATQ